MKQFFLRLMLCACLCICADPLYATSSTPKTTDTENVESRLIAMRVPVESPRMTILGHDAILVEHAGNLSSANKRMRKRWQNMRKEHDMKVFSPQHIPLPQHNRQQWAALSNLMSKADAMKKLRYINGFFNNIPSNADIDIYGEKEYWALPQEFLENRKGDCEDYAITKYFALKHFGWSPKKLWIILLHDKINDGMHAVLAAKHNNNIFILDNLSKPATLLIPEKQYKKQVSPYLMLNDEGIWYFPSSEG